MLYVPTATQTELEAVILEDDDLMAQFDLDRLMNGGYTLDELRDVVTAWVEAGSEV